MQIKRIHPDNWYQTKQGIGKFLSFAGPKLKFEIDGKTVYLSSSDVQHEIAKGEEPQDENEAIPPDVEKIVAELHRLRASNAALWQNCWLYANFGRLRAYYEIWRLPMNYWFRWPRRASRL